MRRMVGKIYWQKTVFQLICGHKFRKKSGRATNRNIIVVNGTDIKLGDGWELLLIIDQYFVLNIADLSQ